MEVEQNIQSNMKKVLILTTTLLFLYSIFTTYKLYTHESTITSDTIRYVIPGDTVFTEKIVIKQVPYKVEIPKKIPIFINDTNCIDEYTKLYLEHYSKKEYIDTVQNDTSMTLIVKSYIFANSLDSSKLYSRNNREKSITTVINKIEPVRKWSGELIIGYKTIIPKFNYSLNNNFEIGTGYDIIDNKILGSIKYNF